MAESETQGLRRKNVQQYKRIAELEAENEQAVLALSRYRHNEVAPWKKRAEQAEAELLLSREQTEYANDAMMAMCERAEGAEAELEAENVTQAKMLDEVLLLLFRARAMDPSSPGARQLFTDLRARAEKDRNPT